MVMSYIYPFGEIRGIGVRKNNETKPILAPGIARFKDYATRLS